MTINCKVGDILKGVWVDVGSYDSYYPIKDIEQLIHEFREDFTGTIFGEVIYFKDNEIAVTYSRNDEKARVIYLRTELIQSVEVLKACKPL